jgi:hypothetical protein
MKITTLRRTCSLSILFAAMSLLGMASAQAETVNCTAIGAIPFTITAPGVYCLKSNKNTNITNGIAITINASNIVLDLNGFTLNGSAAGPGTEAIGIGLSHNNVLRQNITVKNGTVQGFSIGIGFVGSQSLS